MRELEALRPGDHVLAHGIAGSAVGRTIRLIHARTPSRGPGPPATASGVEVRVSAPARALVRDVARRGTRRVAVEGRWDGRGIVEALPVALVRAVPSEPPTERYSEQVAEEVLALIAAELDRTQVIGYGRSEAADGRSTVGVRARWVDEFLAELSRQHPGVLVVDAMINRKPPPSD